MQSRRSFFKRILFGGVVLGLGSGTNTKAQIRSAGVKNTGLPNGYAWQRTIFCQFADPYLASSIGWLAKDLGCDICWGKPFSPDILATPCFIVILDRGTLERDQWVEYLEFRKDVNDTTPCILVDGLGDGKGWAIGDRMEIRDPGNRGHVHGIVRRIRAAHRAAQDWRHKCLPYS
ncbi:MAG TPA: hypothetical protein VM425_07665 [Myxococcota bacterium]|nr:hypothetical protein [Myxococcota bacterium]